jgi:hypothetical protein
LLFFQPSLHPSSALFPGFPASFLPFLLLSCLWCNFFLSSVAPLPVFGASPPSPIASLSVFGATLPSSSVYLSGFPPPLLSSIVPSAFVASPILLLLLFFLAYLLLLSSPFCSSYGLPDPAFYLFFSSSRLFLIPLPVFSAPLLLLFCSSLLLFLPPHALHPVFADCLPSYFNLISCALFLLVPLLLLFLFLVLLATFHSNSRRKIREIY